MNCQAVYEVSSRNYGTPRHAKPVPAKRLVLRDYPTARVAVKGSEVELHQKQAKDGRWVSVEEAVCGIHEKTLKHRTITIPAEVLGQMSWDGIMDYAVRVYERKQDEAEAARQAEWDRYAKHRQDQYDNTTFSITKTDEPGRRMIANWEIANADDGRPVAHVYVEEESGRAWVHIGEYMNSGRGRGSVEYAETLVVVYQKAIDAARRWNDNATP